MRVPGVLFVVLVATFALVTADVVPARQLKRSRGNSKGGRGKKPKTTADGTNSCFFETLAQGESVDIVQHGPITLTAVCEDEIRVDAYITKTTGVDDFIIVEGDEEDAAFLLTMDYLQEEFLEDVTDDVDSSNTDGGIISLGTGTAVEVNGEGVTMWHDTTGIEGFGDGTINCAIAGCATLIDI